MFIWLNQDYHSMLLYQAEETDIFLDAVIGVITSILLLVVFWHRGRKGGRELKIVANNTWHNPGITFRDFPTNWNSGGAEVKAEILDQ